MTKPPDADEYEIDTAVAKYRLAMAEEFHSLERLMESHAQDIEDQLITACAAGRKKPRKMYPKKLSHRHMVVMEWFVEHPTGFQYECAEALGYSVPWISRIVNSRPYRNFYRQLLKEKNQAMASMQMARILTTRQAMPDDDASGK